MPNPKEKQITIYRRKADAHIWEWAMASANQSQLVSRAINLLWDQLKMSGELLSDMPKESPPPSRIPRKVIKITEEPGRADWMPADWPWGDEQDDWGEMTMEGIL